MIVFIGNSVTEIREMERGFITVLGRWFCWGDGDGSQRALIGIGPKSEPRDGCYSEGPKYNTFMFYTSFLKEVNEGSYTSPEVKL